MEMLKLNSEEWKLLTGPFMFLSKWHKEICSFTKYSWCLTILIVFQKKEKLDTHCNSWYLIVTESLQKGGKLKSAWDWP